ncbi:beta-galactosidase [Flavobacterium sp. Fl-77]|uniref:Beta-galactosidase n=1 Tax=Flavobacterium flavipigmentatum TaxID=2893884 RepID=A0AAJ2SD56_9FLAO|nr:MULTISPECIES: beta-galactosidase [unclassified Flavobacterium]MDX6182644.1 beta-galactosidase [Flavobacterium sp. Fl-33]MDX6186176.1 beta-galactosidase [Flavobacterium sp. Fl-77]UFH38323.1 beta-galactosidase [Flavobacterium sp. F-70]
MKQILFRFGILLIYLLTFSSLGQSKGFSISDGEFRQDGKVIKIHSGEMHYERIPREYWRHRLQMLKAMGMNTVATYVFWNYHEIEPGVWDFQTGNKDLAEFIRIAKSEGLFVILRPGPYACGEWEFGGYTWWLQNNTELMIRTNNKAFLEACKTYLQHLYAEIKGLFASEGGPIIMVQVENEFGSYVSQRTDIKASDHKDYKNAIYNLLKETGFKGPFFTSDGTWLFEDGVIEGILPTANGETNLDNLKKQVNKYNKGQGPYMVAEFYSGWLDHWAEPFVKIGTDEIVSQTKKYLDAGVSFNYYMVHGGTNFGFTSGANYNLESNIQPDLTSYDYDAPISEAGWPTPKFMAIREVMQQFSKTKLAPIPEKIPFVKYPNQAVKASMDILSWIKKEKAVVSDQPLTFEKLGQGNGYVLYRKRFTQPIIGTLKIDGLRDFAVVYVNGVNVGELNRVFNKYELAVSIPFNGILEILVENMGRINYGAEIVHNTKGIISPIFINDYEISGGWEMYKMPMNEVPIIKNEMVKLGRPVVYESILNIDKPADTFLDMTDWGKGIVFVNGHNLGRYWKVGPQQTLYVPGCWLKSGQNSIVIYDQLNEKPQTHISFTNEPVLEQLRKPEN